MVFPGYDRRILFSLADKVNAIMSSASIKNERALLILCSSAEVAFQPLCCKLVGGEALVTTMRKHCSLVRITIVCIEPVTVLVIAFVKVIALVNDDWWKNDSRALQLASAPGPAWDWTAW